MKHSDVFSPRYRGEKQTRETNLPDLPTAPQRRLRIQSTAIVLGMRRLPLITGVPADPRLIELLAAPGCQSGSNSITRR